MKVINNSKDPLKAELRDHGRNFAFLAGQIRAIPDHLAESLIKQYKQLEETKKKVTKLN